MRRRRHKKHPRGDGEALALLRQGFDLASSARVDRARHPLERAASAFLAGGDSLRAAFALVVLGSADARLNDHGARSELERALAALPAAQAPSGSRPRPAPPRTRELLSAGSLDSRRRLLVPFVRALAQKDLGLVASREKRFADALDHLEAAVRAFAALGADIEEGHARRILAVTRVTRGDADLAALEFERAVGAFHRAGDQFHIAYTRYQTSGLLYKRGRYEEAIAVLDDARARLAERGWPAHWPLYSKAVNLEKLGRSDEALAAFTAAFDELEAASSRFLAPTVRARWLGDKEQIASHLIDVAWRRGDDELAHRTLQRGKASTFASLLRESRSGDPSALAEYRATREELADLDEKLTERPQALLEKRRRAVLERIERLEATLDASSSKPRGVRPLGLDEIRAALPPGAVLLDYALLRDALRVVLVTANGRKLVTLPRAGVGRGEARASIERALERLVSLTTAARTAVEERDLERASALYERGGLLEDLDEILLGAPEVRAALEAATEVLFVPCRELAAIPFHLLRRDGKYLVERLPVSVLPATPLLARRRPAPKLTDASRVLLLAHGRDDTSARLAASEIEGALHRFRNVCLLSGGEASRQRLESEVSEFDIVHVASHAEFDAEFPTLSHLALGSRERTWERLTVRDVLGLELGPCLVVLSACHTARAGAAPGDAALGLAQAFLAAGARGVLATLWPLDPRASRALLPAFYEALLAGDSPQRALRRGQEVVRSTRELRSPYFWGAFQATPS